MKYKYLFGPVNSRRLGVSLGVDLAPRKVCSLDCVYCEVGATTLLTMERKEYVSFEKITNELKAYMAENPEPDYITLTGSGEPTLNSRFGDVLNFVKSAYPNIKLAVLTNGTLMHLSEVRKELMPADLVMPSLDAVTEEGFKKIDKPESSIDMQQYIQGMVDFGKQYTGAYHLEVLFLKGYNDNDKEIEALKHAIQRINPQRVQLNTLDRPGVLEDIEPLSYAELEQIASLLDFPNIDIIARTESKSTPSVQTKNAKENILELIKRRPCSLEDIQSAMGLNKALIEASLEILLTEGRVEANKQNGINFFRFVLKPIKKGAK
jgi:wyosine [tRNA(Phe)-imidazoG37] synthetase (radical SAM superfamily)